MQGTEPATPRDGHSSQCLVWWIGAISIMTHISSCQPDCDQTAAEVPVPNTVVRLGSGLMSVTRFTAPIDARSYEVDSTFLLRLKDMNASKDSCYICECIVHCITLVVSTKKDLTMWIWPTINAAEKQQQNKNKKNRCGNPLANYIYDMCECQEGLDDVSPAYNACCEKIIIIQNKTKNKKTLWQSSCQLYLLYVRMWKKQNKKQKTNKHTLVGLRGSAVPLTPRSSYQAQALSYNRGTKHTVAMGEVILWPHVPSDRVSCLIRIACARHLSHTTQCPMLTSKPVCRATVPDGRSGPLHR